MSELFLSTISPSSRNAPSAAAANSTRHHSVITSSRRSTLYNTVRLLQTRHCATSGSRSEDERRIPLFGLLHSVSAAYTLRAWDPGPSKTRHEHVVCYTEASASRCSLSEAPTAAVEWRAPVGHTMQPRKHKVPRGDYFVAPFVDARCAIYGARKNGGNSRGRMIS